MRKMVDVDKLKLALSGVCGRTDDGPMDKAMDYVLHEYLPELIDYLAEDVEDNTINPIND